MAGLLYVFAGAEQALVVVEAHFAQALDWPGVGGGVAEEQQAARVFGAVERRAVHHPHVVEGDGAGRAFEGDRVALHIPVELGGFDGAGEVAAFGVVVVVNLALVRAGHDQQRAVLLVAVVEQDAGGEQVVVGVGVEGPVLVPLDGRAVLRLLHVELVVLQPHVGADQSGDDLHQHGVLGEFAEEGPVGVGRLESAHARVVGRVRVLKVVARVVVGQAGGLGDDPVGLVAQRLQRVLGQQAGNQQVTVLVVKLDLLGGDERFDGGRGRRGHGRLLLFRRLLGSRCAQCRRWRG